MGEMLQGQQVTQEGTVGRGVDLGSRKEPCNLWRKWWPRVSCSGLSNEGLTTTLQPLQAVPLGTVVSPVVRAPADRGPWAISAAWKAGCAEQSHT